MAGQPAATQLTKEQLKAVNDTYTFFDFAKNDKINIDDLKSLVRSLGQNPTQQDMIDMTQEIDPSNKGHFSRAQFVKLMSSGWLKDYTTIENEIRDAFRFFDKSGDGFVSITELRFALLKSGDSMADDEIDEMFRLVDTNGDGQISYEEFVKWFTGGRILAVAEASDQ